ncbi:hypothetical protein [Peptostreptococcus sp. D1]|uniref:hypothetical protein n=1 Tax=Peptostreptococcus sp. D1 TaxID=72304 RepID=UPI0008E75D99|nr:hypothetical protein [Peptostreptococcus sp. D1]SFE74804.1 hypothetical protein SAMN02910278_01602 [Peptostreptococcus sp. D1]
MKRKIFGIGIILLVIIIGFIYFVRNNDNIDSSITIKNETSEKLKAVGILSDNKVILNKTNGDKFYIPEKLTNKINEVSIVVVSDTGSVSKSKAIYLKDIKAVSIKELKGANIELNVKTKEKSFEEIDIPELSGWKAGIEGNNVRGSFQAKTMTNYTLYILGKGGRLGASDTDNNNTEVVASWEKPKAKVDSWVVFSK